MVMNNKIGKLLSLLGLTIVFFTLLSCGGGNDPSPVVKNENIFINEIYSAGNDWVELYNNGSTDENIGGYFIYDDILKKFKIPANTIIPSKGFLVLACDATNTGLYTNFKLTSAGETVYLETGENKLIDKVIFPALVEGQSYARYPDGEGTPVITGSITKGVTNGDSQSPSITNVTKSPLTHAKNASITISAMMSGNASVPTVKVYYRLNNASFTAMDMALTTNYIYVATIPATGQDGTFEYYIEAKNTANKTTLSPIGSPTTTYSFVINSEALPQLFINEFMAANFSCYPDVQGAINEYDDWIEIYNAGSTAINIAGMYLSDDPLNPFKFQVPATNATLTTIAAGAYLLIWADEAKSQGELHASFKLSNLTESVGLYFVDGRTIDEKTFQAQSDDTSYGRVKNGGSTWQVFSTATPGASNEF